MWGLIVTVFLAGTSALPYDPVMVKDPGFRYQYVQGPDGTPHLVDSWLKASDIARAAARYDAEQENVYHLFTRDNPSLSQPLLVGDTSVLSVSNYDPLKRTAILIHGWMNSASSDVNAVLANAFLTAADLNVVVVDWSAGAGTDDYLTAVANTVTSGVAVANFINWLISATSGTSDTYHIVGHSLGGQQAGIVGRNLNEKAGYITALDPAYPGWIANDDKFKSDDGNYTEVIHTNAGVLGYLSNLGQVDFYPNGGVNMAGCASPECDHARSTGIYYLQTNAAPPFSVD